MNEIEEGDHDHQSETDDDQDPVDHLLRAGQIRDQLPVQERRQSETAEGDGEAAQWGQGSCFAELKGYRTK